MNQGYHVFLSYARSDNADGWVDALLENLKRAFRRNAGEDLRVFYDRSEIRAAHIWEERILEGLRNSSLMVAILSPSYFKSDWCGREWDYFLDLERERVLASGIRNRSIVFPIKYSGWEKAFRLHDEQKERILQAERRQIADFTGISYAENNHVKHIQGFVEEIIDVLFQLEEERKGSSRRATKEETTSKSGLEANTNTIQRAVGKFGFVDKLIAARRITIVGTYHQGLLTDLTSAIQERAKLNKPFWESIRIVFLSEALLEHVDDQISRQIQPSRLAAQQRILLSGATKRSIYTLFDGMNAPHNWHLYEFNYMLPFVGTFFELDGGSRLVQIASVMPGRNTEDYLFQEYTDTSESFPYYRAVFEEILEQSREFEEIVFVGVPTDRLEFNCKHTRFRRGALMSETRRVNDWLPAFVLLLWTNREAQPTPLYQIRTPAIKSREIDHISSISGYVDWEAYLEVTSNSREDTPPFILPEQSFEVAAVDRLVSEFGLKDYAFSKPVLLRKVPYYFADRESLFFYLCHLEVDFDLRDVLQQAALRPFGFLELLKIREYQVLAKAKELLEDLSLLSEQREMAAKTLADNLILHQQESLAERFLKSISVPIIERRALVDDIAQELKKSKQTYSFNRTKRTIVGLAGLQYRQFFKDILPFYSRIKVKHAQEYNDWVHSKCNDQLDSIDAFYSSHQSIMDVEFEV